MIESIGTPYTWATFLGLVGVLLALDLGVFHRKAHEVTFREAAGWSVFWIGLAFAFNAWIWWSNGSRAGLEFLTGYLVEKALSVDNLFVILMLFSAFAVPKAYRHRVLFWGILGALVMRGVFIGIGAILLERFHWLLYLFGGLLVLTGVKMLLKKDEQVHPERNPLFRAFRRLVPATSEYHGQRFFVREAGKIVATPLLLVLVAVESADLVFAVDSIPAIFAITTDPFIVFTSNVMAILGLRSLFFLLEGVMDRFHHLKTGLALVLAFIGGKMLLHGTVKIPIAVSLGVITTILAAAVVTSLLRPRPMPADAHDLRATD